MAMSVAPRPSIVRPKKDISATRLFFPPMRFYEVLLCLHCVYVNNLKKFPNKNRFLLSYVFLYATYNMTTSSYRQVFLTFFLLIMKLNIKGELTLLSNHHLSEFADMSTSQASLFLQSSI